MGACAWSGARGGEAAPPVMDGSFVGVVAARRDEGRMHRCMCGGRLAVSRAVSSLLHERRPSVLIRDTAERAASLPLRLESPAAIGKCRVVYAERERGKGCDWRG